MEGATPLSEALTARVNEFAAKACRHWADNCTPEQKAAGIAAHEEYKNDPEVGAREMARVTEDWNSSDANGDGFLDQAEFIVYQEKQRVNAASKGTFAGKAEGHDEEWYAILNDINTEHDGISFMEYMSAIGVFVGKMESMKAELGA